jgi:glycosyltransferase involved in cell wall biosynthesis
LIVPPNVELIFIFVENDSQPSSEAIIHEIMEGHNYIYQLEHRMGISIARNTAVQLAIKQGASAIAFFDDDEQVAPDWLMQLHQAMLEKKAMLVGGPLRFNREPQSGFVPSLMAHGIDLRYQWREFRSRLFPRDALISTNNCLIDTRLFTEHRLAYDESLSTSEDRRLYNSAKALGLEYQWVSQAIVTESWTSDRLSIGYCFRRGREQSITWLGIERQKNALAFSVGVFLKLLSILLSSMVSILVCPLVPSLALVQSTRNAGRLFGIFKGLCGGSPAKQYL